MQSPRNLVVNADSELQAPQTQVRPHCTFSELPGESARTQSRGCPKRLRGNAFCTPLLHGSLPASPTQQVQTFANRSPVLHGRVFLQLAFCRTVKNKRDELKYCQTIFTRAVKSFLLLSSLLWGRSERLCSFWTIRPVQPPPNSSSRFTLQET